MEAQTSLFDFPKLEVTGKIRLIELFGGIGSQAMALRDIGADFEHYRLVEFDKYAVNSYNAIHETDFPVMDIRDVHGKDLGITDKDKYTYIMTYSFPCTDLSVAGKMKGMSKEDWQNGNATRSGLLWEVERILKDLPDEDLPQILLMENVIQVHAEQNKVDFDGWLDYLKSRGYFNYWKDLNGKDYGIPQNRERCFCLSILTKEYLEYNFPNPITLNKVMKDFLEPSVDEKYYITNQKADELIKKLIQNGMIDNTTKKEAVDLSTNKPKVRNIANCIKAQSGHRIAHREGEDNGVVETIDLTVNNPRRINIANCITAHVAKDGAAISKRASEGNGVIEGNMIIEKEEVSTKKVRFLGNYINPELHDGYAGSVFDKNGITPALNTMSGGNRQPLIIEEKPNLSGCVNTLTTVQKDNLLLEKGYIEIKQATKEGAIRCKVGGCFDASYPNSKTRRGRVQQDGDITPTLTASNSEAINYIERIQGADFEKGISEILCILQSKIGEESFSEWAVRGLYCFLQKEILQQKLYAKKLFESWSKSTDMEQFTYDSEGNQSVVNDKNQLRNMWEKWKARCSPYRQQLSEQQYREFESFVQRLSCEDTSPESLVFCLWKASERIWILRKALSEIQEIWESFNDKQRSQPYYRIRKLTPREVWRLMGYTDTDFDKAAAVNSNTQLYKQAGNAIVKQVLMAIFASFIK